MGDTVRGITSRREDLRVDQRYNRHRAQEEAGMVTRARIGMAMVMTFVSAVAIGTPRPSTRAAQATPSPRPQAVTVTGCVEKAVRRATDPPTAPGGENLPAFTLTN